MAGKITRRNALRRTALTGSALWLSGSTVKRCSGSPNDKLNIACIGIGGRGGANVNGVKGENIVALCDVDDKRAGNQYKKFPWAKKYYDFRVMLDELNRQIDAVVVSTPDHTHFHPSWKAMMMGKHLYLEKPLAPSPWEIRQLTDLARKKKLQTQLGAQRHTYDNMHRVVELIQGGAIGKVKEAHAWVGGTRGMPAKPTEFPDVPEHLKWDLWVGPAEMRPYSPAYCPYNWRFWWDFGTGETGNWGCHILDIPFWALKLKYPTSAEGSGPPVDPERSPKSMKTKFQFPARGDMPPVTLNWYHSGKGPEVLKKHNLPHYGSGALFVGSDGMLLTSFNKRELFPKKKFEGFKGPDKFIPDSPGFYKEWILACKGGKPATCNFEYSGPLAETVILGNVAYRAGVAFKWDAENLKPSSDSSKLAALIKPTFKKGWQVSDI